MNVTLLGRCLDAVSHNKNSNPLILSGEEVLKRDKYYIAHLADLARSFSSSDCILLGLSRGYALFEGLVHSVVIGSQFRYTLFQVRDFGKKGLHSGFEMRHSVLGLDRPIKMLDIKVEGRRISGA